MCWVRDNLLTILFACITVVILTVFIPIQVEIAYLIWFIAFMLDATYTFLNRRYVKMYELNMIVRRSKDIVTAFIKVLCIEYAIIYMLSLFLLDSSGLALLFILFAVIHTSAFIRSYLFINKIKQRL